MPPLKIKIKKPGGIIGGDLFENEILKNMEGSKIKGKCRQNH